MITNFESPNLQRKIIKKNKKLFLKFSPSILLIVLYQLAKFEGPTCSTYRDIMNTNFQSPNLQREIIRKKNLKKRIPQGNLHIILYQLTKFETPSCNTFRDIMITNFQSPNLQRELIRKKIK